jgi:protein-S-isoprenylcysteine O-methyltransferase Ste14
MEIYLLVLAWAFYFFIHSFLASNESKNWVARKLPTSFRYYRIVYNVIALTGLLPLIYWSMSSSIRLLDAIWPIGIILMAVGSFLLIQAFRVFDGAEFIGLKEETKPQLVQIGMYRYVRHPLYFATIVLILGLFFLFPTQKMLLTLLVSYIYIGIGHRLEERKLIGIFGEEYRAYQRRVKALIPYIY